MNTPARWPFAVARIVGLLPRWSLPWLGAALGWLVGTVLRIRRVHVEGAMRRAGIRDASRHAAAMYRELGTSLVEFLWAGVRPYRVEDLVRFAPGTAERLAMVLERGSGAIVCASHTANWELAAAKLARIVPVTVVAKPVHVRSLHALCNEWRRRLGVEVVSPRAAWRGTRDALARGRVVVFVIDQVPDRTRHAVPCSFLGAPALVDRSPVVFAGRLGVPMVVAAGVRRGPITELSMLALHEPEAGVSRAWVHDVTRAMTRALEGHVLEAPSAWLWLHRRWRTPLVESRHLPAEPLDEVLPPA